MADDSEDGVWALGQKDDPPRSISRWRSDLKAPDPKRPVRVTIGVMFRETRPDGMPATSAENDFCTRSKRLSLPNSRPTARFWLWL